MLKEGYGGTETRGRNVKRRCGNTEQERGQGEEQPYMKRAVFKTLCLCISVSETRTTSFPGSLNRIFALSLHCLKKEKRMIVCIAEKPSVARDIADVLGAKDKKDGYIEGNGYQVTWTFRTNTHPTGSRGAWAACLWFRPVSASSLSATLPTNASST